MSKTVDNRVVEMRFDNSQFERNVSQSMSTLEKLKRSLKLEGSAKGFENISRSAKQFDISPISNGVETVKAKFSALEVMAVTALANITNSAVNAGKRIVSALTIDPIKTGFQEYETQINAVQTILANTKSKGTTLDDVNSALDTLNTYADKTIYNFTEMARNIGTFTAAGVDLDTSVKSIQGIANLAAMSGSTSQQASTAMYQLSQALAAGKVSLMDWNSVVNAGMGGEVFQNALKRTAKAMGTDVDAIIKKYGSFRESLTQGDWLTTDVLTKTLEQFTMAAEKGTEQWEEYKKSLMEEGYTAKQAEEILEMANTATEAATKVKTFTQLWDTVKEAAQSGWAQTWEILIGDFEEAKELLTNISDVINDFIVRSANARNEMLQGWKDMGGRTDLIESIKNVFEGLMSVIKPIGEAFREIFPPITSKQLYEFTAGLKELTSNLKLTDEQSSKVKSTFKGLFAVVDIFLTIIKDVAGGIVKIVGSLFSFGDGILSVAETFGDWLVKLRDGIKETNVFGKCIDSIANLISNMIDRIREFGSAISESFRSDGYKFLFDMIKNIGSIAIEAFSSIGRGLSNVFSGSNLGDAINSGVFGGLLAAIAIFVKKIFSPFESMFGVLENVSGILDDVRGCLQAYQAQLKAEALIKIATAIAILAGAIFVISTINPEALAKSLAAITVLFVELMGSLMLFGEMSMGFIGVTKAMGLMITMSIAILILAGALKTISSINTDGIIKGLVAIGVLMVELSLFLNNASFGGKLTTSSIGLIALATAMVILAKAVGVFGGMDWSSICKGLAAIGGLLVEVAIFANATGNAKHVISSGMALVLFGSAMSLFASAMKSISGMSWGELARALVGMAGALAAVTIAMNLMPKNMIFMGTGLVIVAGAMNILFSALSDFGGMSWDEIGRGLAVMGGALAELAIGLNLMNGTLAGSAALLIAAASLAIIAPVIRSLGEMSWGGIAKGLVTLAGAFAVVGVAGLLLAPLIPTILGLSVAFALFGVSVLGIGAGLALIGIGLTSIATGFAALATAGVAGAIAIVASLTVIITGILDLIPTIIDKIKLVILSICTAILECAPQIADTILVVISEVLSSLSTYAPQIVDSLMTFIIEILNSLSERLPELISAAMNVISAFFQGIIDALNGMDVSSIFKGIIAVGLLAGLMLALSAITSLIPGAMAGVLGMGIVIAELALVLAAIGALAQIPGLSWLISEGGNFLQTIGTAIGQFIGGIVGGIAQGATASLPQIGSNLSDFMNNLQPFIDGVKSLDASMLEGVKSLTSAILMLTGANLLDAITSWITGGNPLGQFAEQLVTFGTAIKNYASEVSGINTEAISTSVTSAKELIKIADSIPDDGLFGTDGIDDFGKNIIKFGECLKVYSDEVAGIDVVAITTSVSAAKGLVKVAKLIPDDGAFGTDGIDDFGDNIVDFAKALKKYSEKASEISTSAISSSITSARSLVSFVNSLSGIDTSGVSSFKRAIAELSTVNVSGVIKAFSSASGKLKGVGGNLITSLVGGMKAKQGSVKSVAASIMTAFAAGLNSKKATAIKIVTTMIGDMLKSIKSKNNSFKAAGVALITNLISGINSKRAAVNSAVKSCLAGAASSLRSYYGSFHSAGSYLAQGFANGIRSGSFAAKTAATAMANAAKDAARRALDERSPSKEFYKIGAFAGQGFVNALYDYADVSYKAGSVIADHARDGLTKAVSKASDIINSDIDTQPTIRPVMDLSDIVNGSRMMNKLLGEGAPVSVMANVGSISSMMNRNQNGVNSDLISAINKLRGDLSNIGNTTYTVNGVTYGDGSEISKAVRTLVRAAKIERRS